MDSKDQIASATSPTSRVKDKAKAPETFDFPTAMAEVIKGRIVSKIEWDNPAVVVYLEGHLRIRLDDGVAHDLIVSDGDMLGRDWFVVGDLKP